ncbi:aspartate beta-hydroxylase domain-containing protein 2-like [Homarus americanus]|uniref:Aspartate beta-hydroxylase domain-containing protein 2-like n=1 Tax=Homarus americanus TaxID=6706 RepID=A0A8J5NBR0_HOMAM|nr:aspartate beta-hydroxylase domain-containing protein 2-like [Homarus americanus]KAG7177395.1 Aspartate beta-hydroxylase domain-containing protein 2-like [Homarus americanus]
MGVRECCATFLAGLPNPALPFLPALVMGTSFAAFFLFMFYKKYTNLPVKVILIHMLKKIFYLLPTHDHSESETCKNPGCVRCKKYEELKTQIVQKMKEIRANKPEFISQQLEDAVKKIEYESSPFSKCELDDEPKKKKSNLELQKPTLFYMELAANPYWNDFEVYKKELGFLKLNFSIILKDFMSVFNALKNGDNWGWKLNDIDNGHWCIFPFIDQGRMNKSNSQRCPNVSAILEALPSLMKDCVFGNACFSILYPDSHIEPHHGPSNVRLRCHLGLNIPDGCWLEVAGTQYKWKKEETVLFDDSFEHSATFVNQSSSSQATPRAVLLVDFWHPDITSQEKEVLLELLAP